MISPNIRRDCHNCWAILRNLRQFRPGRLDLGATVAKNRPRLRLGQHVRRGRAALWPSGIALLSGIGRVLNSSLYGNFAVIRGLTDWARQAFLPQLGRRRRRCLTSWVAAELLESRQLLTVTLGQPLVNNIPAGKDGLIALPVTNTTLNPVSYTVQSSNPGVSASIVTGGQSLLLNVTGKDAAGQNFVGDLTFRLFDDAAPLTVAQIEDLVNTNFYDGLTFHRILSGFVAQGGDPLGNGTGGSGTKIPDEFQANLTFTGQGLLAMANSGSDTGDSQFFITAIDETLGQLPEHLNFKHTIFGILTSGFDTFRSLMSTPTNSAGRPNSTVEITNATIFTDNQQGVLRVTPAAGFTGSTTLTVRASDGQGNTDERQVAVTIVPDTINDRAF
ncbi:MAG: peptidylprolyl isomerase, partial [Planctomycetaceae bacterium]